MEANDYSLIVEEIREKAFPGGEKGRGYMCISSAHIGELASRHILKRKEVSALALRNGIVPLKYTRNIGTLSIEDQIRLLDSRVLIVGCGGIGSRVAEILARAGVGTIVCVDHDVYDESNLNRQAFSTEDNVGSLKVHALREEISRINNDIEVVSHAVRATRSSLPELLGSCQVAIDALDTLNDRLILQDCCEITGKPLVHGAIAGTSLQVMTILPGDPGLKSVYLRLSDEEEIRGMEIEAGTPPVAPAIVSAVQAYEAVRICAGKEPLLRNRLLFIDLENLEFEVF